jgi:AcrR family transcriptional regulator
VLFRSRAAIIKAVRRLFADKGFHGTTTHELAEAAGVSEALLFKHFPHKEALYSAMLTAWVNEHEPVDFERLEALEPSASALVLLVHDFLSHTLEGPPGAGGDRDTTQTRLVLRSLTEDGEFARLFLQGLPSRRNQKVAECLQAAIAAGEAVDGPVRPRLAGWFSHHLARMLRVYLLPPTPAVDYGIPREELVEQAVWFSLRGMGLKDEAIKRYYNPEAFSRGST